MSMGEETSKPRQWCCYLCRSVFATCTESVKHETLCRGLGVHDMNNIEVGDSDEPSSSNRDDAHAKNALIDQASLLMTNNDNSNSNNNDDGIENDAEGPARALGTKWDAFASLKSNYQDSSSSEDNEDDDNDDDSSSEYDHSVKCSAVGVATDENERQHTLMCTQQEDNSLQDYVSETITPEKVSNAEEEIVPPRSKEGRGSNGESSVEEDDRSMTSLWECVICKVAAFDNYEDALAHEKECTGTLSSASKSGEEHTHEQTRPQFSYKAPIMAFCKHPGCSTISRKSGLCFTHYQESIQQEDRTITFSPIVPKIMYSPDDTMATELERNDSLFTNNVSSSPEQTDCKMISLPSPEQIEGNDDGQTINTGRESESPDNGVELPRGVTMTSSGKWASQLYYAGKSRYIGIFNSTNDASAAYERARECSRSLENGDLSPEQIEENVKLICKTAKGTKTNNECKHQGCPNLVQRRGLCWKHGGKIAKICRTICKHDVKTIRSHEEVTNQAVNGDVTFSLFTPGDETHINQLHNLIRRDIWEGFVVNNKSAGDYESNKGDGARRKARVGRYEGTVGFRCKWCKHVKQCDRADTSAVYPRSITRIYSSSIRFQRDHIL